MMTIQQSEDFNLSFNFEIFIPLSNSKKPAFSGVFIEGKMTISEQNLSFKITKGSHRKKGKFEQKY